MVAIEHNPTHIDSSLLEGRAAHSEGAENRLEGIIPKKNRKKDGLGAFSKLLAGLVSKKPLRQGENNPKTAQDGSIFFFFSESGTKKTVFPNVTEAKKAKNPKEGLAVIKENKQKEAANQGLEGLPPLNFEFARLFPSDVKETQTQTQAQTQTFTSPVSFKTDNFAQIKDIPERKLPFKKGEMTDNAVLGDHRNAALQSKKKEKAVQTEGEIKKAGKKKNSFSVEIRDQRTQTGAEAGTIAERGLKGAEEIRNSSEREIIVELRPEREQNGKPLESGQKAPAGETFEQLLARELRGDLSADIVRQAAIVLRDGGEGTIKLSLKPETLGKVKIHLEMAENRIEGLIFVENEEALRAFEQEIHTLEQSFRDSGFEASLNAALDYQDNGQRWKEKEILPVYSERFAVTYDESSTVEISTGLVSTSNVLV
jgi:flagellar hook-length control protein FliK